MAMERRFRKKKQEAECVPEGHSFTQESRKEAYRVGPWTGIQLADDRVDEEGDGKLVADKQARAEDSEEVKEDHDGRLLFCIQGSDSLPGTVVSEKHTDKFVSRGGWQMAVSKKEISPCPIDAMLSVIDGRWKGTILWHLVSTPLRPSELRRLIPEITERMLIRHLQELVSDGILLRQEEEGRPPRVRYCVSEYGMTLVPVLESICVWGRTHLARVASIR
jgi:DNA-binding HxlR family transcriptional regulator